MSMLPPMPPPPTTAPSPRRAPETSTLPPMAATASGASYAEPQAEPPPARPKTQPAGGAKFRGSKYFVTSSPRSLSPQNNPKRRSPSPPHAAGGEALHAVRVLSLDGNAEEGPTAVQGSRLHFSTPLARDTTSGGPLYGAGSFANPEALGDFLTKCEIDTAAWNEGEAKGLYGLHRELEQRLATLQIEDRRLVRCERIVKVRAHRQDSSQYLVERRTTQDGRDPSEFFQAVEAKKQQPKVMFKEEKVSRIDLWQSATATIFATKGTMLAGRVSASEKPFDAARRLAEAFTAHAAEALGVDSPAQRQGILSHMLQGATGFIKAIASKLESSGMSPYSVEMMGLVQEADEYALTPHYPGLVTHRTFQEYAARIPILPDVDFTSASMLGTTEVTHHWEWHDVHVQHPGIVLRPTQLWLLEALFAGCSRVEVTKLHPFQDANADSLVLRTKSYDINGEADEPTITKIDQAQAIVAEMEKTQLVLKSGIDAIHVIRPPIFAKRDSGEIVLTSDARIDAPLRDHLSKGAIRLLKCSWILSEESDDALGVDLASGASVMSRRKDLPREAFFPYDEAVVLLDRGDRSVFVLSQCWQTTEHPDPHGHTLLAIRSFLRSEPGAAACGLFWDWTGLDDDSSVGWRSEDTEHRIVLPLYASIAGTTVLQMKDVPLRPPQYDGLVMLFGVAEGTSEDALAGDVSEFGQVLECEIFNDQAAVHFSKHEHAVDMVAQIAARHALGPDSENYPTFSCYLAYDERPYDGENGRGWSIFEQGVCMTMAAHVAWAQAKRQLPQRFKLAQETRPKVVDISHGNIKHPNVLVDPEAFLEKAIEDMKSADFTAEDDRKAATNQLKSFRKLITSELRVTDLENLGAAVFGMAGACWTLPEYCTKLSSQSTHTLKEHIMRQLWEFGDTSKFKLPITVLRDLWGPGGPLNTIAYKTIKRGDVLPLSGGGLIDQTLRGIIDALSSGLFAPLSSLSDSLREVARAAGYTPTAPSQYRNLNACVAQLLSRNEYSWVGEIHAGAEQQVERFGYSFVLDPDTEAWADVNGGQSLVEVIELLEKGMKRDPSLRGVKSLDKPLLLTYAHKNLNLENIIVDAAGSLWLSNFIDSGFAGLFEDAVKIISELLFENFPVPFTIAEVKGATAERLVQMFQLGSETASRLMEAAADCEDTAQLKERAKNDEALADVLPRIAEDAVAAARAKEACAVLATLLAPLHENSSDVHRVPTLIKLSRVSAPTGWSSHAKLMLKLISTIVEFSYELCAKCSQLEQARSTGDEGASYLEEDLHVAHFLLPLLRMSLQSTYDKTLSLWQKRVAWKASQMLASASCEVLRRPSAAPPKYSHRSKNMKLADGQLIALRTSESRADGRAGTNLPLIVGERGKTSPSFDSCSHVVLPWSFRERGGAAAAVIECGGLHDYQVEMPHLLALIKEVPVPPDAALCLPFDIPTDKMTSMVEGIMAQLVQVASTCTTPAVRKEVKRADNMVRGAWSARCKQRAVYEADMAVEIKLGTTLVQEINLLQGERWRMEAAQKKREVDIQKMKEAAIERAQGEKTLLDTQIAIERRKTLKFKQRLLLIKENTRRRMIESQQADREADNAASQQVTARMTMSRDETLEEQAIRERNEANARKRRKEEDSRRQRLAEEEAREKAHIQKKETESKRILLALQMECAQIDQKLRAAREMEDRVRVQDGERLIEPAWLGVDVEACITTLRTLHKPAGLDMSGKTSDQKFDDLVKGELKPFAARHPKITALLRKEIVQLMEEDAQNKASSERKKRDPFIDKILQVRYAIDEYNSVNEAIESSIEKEIGAKKRQKMVAADEAKLRKVEMKQQADFCLGLMEAVRFASLERDTLDWCSAAIKKNGALGARDYADGQQLIVRCQDGMWRDCVVLEPPTTDGDNTHLLLIDSDMDVWEEGDSFGTETRLMLDPFNHAPRELPIGTFDIMRARWARTLRAQHATTVDPLTGSRIDVTQLRVSMVGLETSRAGGGELGPSPMPLGHEVADAEELTDWLQRAHALRCDGASSFRASVLLTGPPASGKTCMLSQIAVHLLDGNEKLDGNLVPIYVPFHDLQRRLLSDTENSTFGQAWNWIDAYMQLVHGVDSETYSMLRQALMARRALLLLDGIDEGGVARDRIVRHATEVLAPQGHMLVMTSRPNALNGAIFDEHFHQLQLQPLSDQQQTKVVENRLSAEKASKLTKWIHKMLPPEATPKESGQAHRLTANPLMLTLIISLYEHRVLTGAKAPMPQTMVEVYETACSVMLQRVERVERGAVESKVSEPHISRLLEAVFHEAHNARERVIQEEHLEMAALSLVAPQQLKLIQARDSAALRQSALKISVQHLPPELSNALRILRESLLTDKLPVLRLLQANPLQMISHLSFQEYYTARALCRGRPLDELPWKWSPWWANVLKLGLELGDQFGSGLLRASAATDSLLSLKGQLPRGDRPLSIDAIIALVRSKDTPLTFLDLSGNRLEEAEMLSIGTAMLSNVKCQITGIKADAFNLTPETTTLEVPRMRIRPEAFVLLAGAIRSNTTLTSLDVSSNYMVQWAGHERNRLVPVELCGVEAMALAISDKTRRLSSALKHLDLSSNSLGVKGAAVISPILTNKALRSVSLRDNKLGDEGFDEVLAGLEDSHLDSLCLAENAIGLGGVRKLANALKRMTKLTSLDFSSNHVLGNSAVDAPALDGAQALGKAIGRSNLKQIDLSSCQLCGVWDDADTGKHGDTSSFTTDGVQAIADGIAACSSLTTVAMHRNLIELSPPAMKILDAANKQRSTPVALNFSDSA